MFALENSLAAWAMNGEFFALVFLLFEDHMQKHIGLKFRRWLQISLLIRRDDGWVSHTDTTRHFSHQAFTDENEWCSLKEVAFGIDYIVQSLLLLFMDLIVLFSIIFEFHDTN